MRILCLFLFACVLFPLQAQRFFSLTANVSGLSIVPFATGGTNAESSNYNYSGSSSYSLNARFFAKKDIAFRVGLGMSNLSYTVNGGNLAMHSVNHSDTKGVLGAEMHIRLDKKRRFTFYPGVFVPVTWTGKLNVTDMTTDVKNSYTTGNMRAGLGLNAGFNVRFLRIFRVGVEADCAFQRAFQAYSDATMYNYLPIQELQTNLYGTLGLSF